MESKKKKRPKTFKPGTVVVWEPKHFSKAYWDGLTEQERLKYYWKLGYGREKPKLFVYLTEINNEDGTPSGHCVLVDMDDGHIEVMRHTCEFRKATREEF